MDSQARLSSLDKSPSTILKPRSYAFTWPRGLFALLLLSALSCGCARSAKVDAAPAPVVAVVDVARHDLSNTLEIASEFLPFQEIDVYAKVSGYTCRSSTWIGEPTSRKGRFWPTWKSPSCSSNCNKTKRTFTAAKATCNELSEELNRAQSEYNVAHLTYTRLADVQKTQPGLVASRISTSRKGRIGKPTAGVSAAKDSLAASEQALPAAKAAFEKDKALFAYSHITAPFDGVVTPSRQYTGALLPAGTSSNIGNSALCHLSAERPAAAGHSRAGKRRAGGAPRTEDRREGLGARIGPLIGVGRSNFSDNIDLQTRTMHTEVHVPNPEVRT